MLNVFDHRITLLIMIIDFKNTYVSQLSKNFHTKTDPEKVKNPELICFNNSLANDLGINDYRFSHSELAKVFSGNVILKGSEPIALVYAGHQFGYFVPQLGDGRAVLLGEVIDRNGILRDIQLKGSGRTPYSRRGDGRAALGPMIREFIVSEAMHALGIKTTRSLAVVKTGEDIISETISPGAVLTRVAASHIRIGSFEYFSAKKDFISLKILADYTIERHYPEAKMANNPYRALLMLVMEAQISLIINWLSVGFVHGVMNTDNMTLSGETIDYGPCAFIDEYNPEKVFSSIDQYGRYAFNNQKNACLWNLTKLAQSLSPLIFSSFKKNNNVINDLENTF